ncbi:RNaseH domain-containing protein [Kitasatospora sp. NPDC058046]|uniref:RNaseH domain-containing protein n=1 Tax=Kitasatospora sp. NPDC058046 TaxID=3346312 RepID=UPI0036DBEDF5
MRQQSARHRSHPPDLPGLRIVRVNDGGTEIRLAFGVNLAEPNNKDIDPTQAPDQDEADGEEHLAYNEWGRYSGVVKWNAHAYLAINPRPDTQQLAKTASKYDGPDYLHRHGANPHSLEMHVSFYQPKDNPADLAAYVNNLRRCHLHTDTPTTLPWLQHHAKLMEEYIV